MSQLRSVGRLLHFGKILQQLQPVGSVYAAECSYGSAMSCEGMLKARRLTHSSASTSSSVGGPPPDQNAPPAASVGSISRAASAQTFSAQPLVLDEASARPLPSSEYKSSMDDRSGVQRTWFTSLYKQLNYIAKSGALPAFKDKQKAAFEQVEREFEELYIKYIKDKALPDDSHRSMLMCCLSVATYRVLNDELGDTKMVRDIIRTNLGGVMLSLLRPVHRFKLWFMRWVLREDMYQQALNMLPAVTGDMGALCQAEVVQETAGVTTLTVPRCDYHTLMTQEETPFLLTEFCCHHALFWLHEFRAHGVIVSLDQCMAWDDGCCKMRIARPGQPVPAQPGAPPTGSAGSSGS